MYIREERPALSNLFTRQMVEPVLTQDELIIWTGVWPGQAIVQSTIVLESPELIAVHVKSYPCHSFTELWRYYWYQKRVWQMTSWNQLSAAERVRVLEAYGRYAPAWSRWPGNLPDAQADRSLKVGPTYLLALDEERGLVSLRNRQVCYTLGKTYERVRSHADKEIMLIKWHQQNKAGKPAQIVIVECAVGGEISLAQGIVEAEWLRPVRIVEG